MNTSSDDSLNTGVAFLDAFFPYVERTSCKTPPNPLSPFSMQVFFCLFVFLTGIMQEILVIRLDCVLSQPVHIPVPSLCVCLRVWGQL